MKNEKLKRGFDIMLSKEMKKNRKAIAEQKVKQEIYEGRRQRIIQTDIEAQTTNNAYTDNYCLIIVEKLSDEHISGQARDVRHFYSKQAKVPYDVEQETQQEFDSRQYQICKKLGMKYPSRKYDRKYTEEMED